MWIGTNSIIVGKVSIGNDVLIAPLTYCNFDVPDHSIVIGNPGKIIPRIDATKDYIDKTILNANAIRDSLTENSGGKIF